MLGPPQNININISYNLANDKPSKGVMGRKILKSGKINHNLVVPHEQDIKHRRTPMEKKSGYAYGSCDFGEKDAAKKNN